MTENDVPVDLDHACRRVLGGVPRVVSRFTTGHDGDARGTVRLSIDGRTVYATRRRNADVTKKEALILRALTEAGAPVARFLGFEGGWLLAGDAGTRLSHQLNSPADAPRRLLRSALDALRQVRCSGAVLASHVPAFARGDRVAQALAARTSEIAEHFATPLPDGAGATRDAIRALLATAGEAFVKWDARPANAAVGEDGVIRWFDFQHANVRWPADDAVWLLCDESVPETARADELLADEADAHTDDPSWSPRPARAYVASLGVSHVLVRLTTQLDARAGGHTPSWETCLREDWNGSDEGIARLLRRGAAVAGIDDVTAPLVPWFEELAATRP